MEWKNIKDLTPENDQTILASINGVYKIVRYVAAMHGLTEIATGQFFSLAEKSLSIYWMEIDMPER